jgi:hypothetical protein
MGLMTLERHEFMVEEALRRSDAALARKLAAPIGCRRLSLAGLALGHSAAPIAGGLALLTIYPLVLVLAKKRKTFDA